MTFQDKQPFPWPRYPGVQTIRFLCPAQDDSSTSGSVNSIFTTLSSFCFGARWNGRLGANQTIKDNAMKNQSRLEILAFTDPVCTWCWGSDPVLRKLETWYGDAVSIRYVMGGLVEDIRAFHDRANGIGGDPERSNQQIAQHWLEASERHGMPVRTAGFRLFSAEAVSTYPQNIAFKAAELTNPALAAPYLRRLREASAAEARETGRQTVLIELASELGLDLAAFIGHLQDTSTPTATKALARSS